MQAFEWSLPTRIVFGAGRFSQVGKLVKGMGKRAFVVTSRSFASGGARADVLKALLDDLREKKIETRVFSDVVANPTVRAVDLAAAAAREFKPGFVIALGGGSVMDTAKATALLLKNEGSIWDYAYKGPGSARSSFNSVAPVVCIPTLAATGSETSIYSVVTDEASRTKSTIFSELLRPAISVIDPALTVGVSRQQTVDGAFDIISHAIETYLSSREPAPLQDRMSEALIGSVADALRVVLKRPEDLNARGQLSWAAAVALSGVLAGREGGWPIHALEHGLTVATGVGHGRGLAMLLPRVVKFDSAVIGEKLSGFNQRVFGAGSNEEGFFRFMRDVGAWWTWERVGVAEADVERTIDAVIEHTFRVDAVLKRDEAEPFLENVRLIRPGDARAILNDCSS